MRALVVAVVAIVLCVFINRSHALKCKSDGGPKEDELKTVYMNCVKRQDSNSSGDAISSRSSWGGERRSNHESKWNKGRGDGMNMRDRDDTSMSQSDEYGREMPRYDNSYHTNHRSTTPPSRRYKRESRMEKNSGHRSQYNPNTSQKNSGYDSDTYRKEDKNSGDNMTRDEGDTKACVLHCFLEELEMVGDDEMPDRYLVTNVLTKNVKSKDLKDFLQESIEECFQILYNENYQDKCEFSKNLLMCLSEKGRANCDDWRDDIRF